MLAKKGRQHKQHLRSKFNSLFLDARTCSGTRPTKDDHGNNPRVTPDNKSDKLGSTTVIPQTVKYNNTNRNNLNQQALSDIKPIYIKPTPRQPVVPARPTRERASAAMFSLPALN